MLVNGDSILFRQENQVMLIDSGTKSKGDTVVHYLKDLGINKIDILIGTHPHDDHMGGMAEVIRNFEIENVYTPDTSKENITTSWYIDFLEAVNEKNVTLIYPKVGDILELGEASIQIMAPNSNSYEDINNYSIVTKVVYGQVGIICMGDAEKISEEEILENGLNVQAQIIKIGHHGSNTSNSEKFISTINPQFALISAKRGNTYGHPNKPIMELLEEKKIEVYRTDETGTIVMKTDGININFNKEQGSYLPRRRNVELLIYCVGGRLCVCP